MEKVAGGEEVAEEEEAFTVADPTLLSNCLHALQVGFLGTSPWPCTGKPEMPVQAGGPLATLFAGRCLAFAGC